MSSGEDDHAPRRPAGVPSLNLGAGLGGEEGMVNERGGDGVVGDCVEAHHHDDSEDFSDSDRCVTHTEILDRDVEKALSEDMLNILCSR